ncbi:hypothetical protein KVP40.0370 [Vibrio phage KVP40]|uniref:Uncharacterized protein n=1 Tax=Vibrio phage KVP40 (isolate Vibrio parahaemolyticus/Japan/Matsuzaki/1991) TaxID=75320 RepID=Q6WHD5_BPKVM|nr:hypothetical protein KVP40.0370 [Vibrio phage KVP40]AAQ64438.1 hypothetical protein KVP40.0370 [Vibrio phage KVP40]
MIIKKRILRFFCIYWLTTTPKSRNISINETNRPQQERIL